MELNFKPNKNKVLNHLVSLYGIGFSRAKRFHKLVGLNLRLSSFYLLRTQREKIVSRLTRLVISQSLRKYLYKIQRFAFQIRLRRGVRNKLGLPSRGQNTRTNAKTKKKFRY